MALQAGHPFGNYRGVRLLGEGGFGEVYLVENPLIQRRAAVKVLHATLAQDSELVRRFLNEARAASAIQHRNIIEVFDAGVTSQGAPYILMEFLEGVSLQKRLTDKGRLALPQALEIARQAGSALAAAHAAGIVHRDLKPENLFLVPEPAAAGGERVKILDFGIAKISHSSDSAGTLRTQSGLIMGSPSYMSPEQCKDSADVDLRSDIYSFATIVYKMLAGRTPYVAASGTETLLMHLSATPPPLREWVPDVPAHVEAAVMRGLARSRADRFDSMASFIGALRGEASAGAAPLSRPSPSAEFPAVVEGPGARAEVTRTSTEVLPATGEARSAGGGPMAATRRLPVAGEAPRAERPHGGQASTTFSRATGELSVPANGDGHLTVTRGRRWPLLVLGAGALSGLALFLLVRPSHDFAPRRTSGTLRIAATDARVAGPAVTRPEEPAGDDGRAAVLPSRADGGLAPPAVAGVLHGRKAGRAAVGATSAHRHHAQAPRPTPQRVPAAAGGSPGNPLPSNSKKQDDVAGF